MNLPKLQEKDTICIIAPAGALLKEQLKTVVGYIEKQGFLVEYGQHTFSKYENGYNFSGTEQQRTEDLQWALDHPTAKAIWCARGGYGGVHLVDNVDFTAFQKNPKWFMGYSDNSVLHQYFSKQNIPSLHSITVKPLSENQSEESYKSLFKVLQEDTMEYSFPTNTHNTEGSIQAKISGGNLSILYSLLGTETLDNFENKILFIEDWQENWYHLDRMLMSLERNGIFKKIAGLIVGSFTKMDTQEENPNYNEAFDAKSYEIIQQRTAQYSFPKMFGVPFGHIDHNLALVLGKEVEMTVTESSSTLVLKNG